MSFSIEIGSEIVPGYVLVRRLGAGMAGEVWVARASGGVQVAIKIIRDLDMLGSQRELGALRVVKEVKHPNLCPLFGIWFFDKAGKLLDPTQTNAILFSDSSIAETICLEPSDDRSNTRSSDDFGFDEPSQESGEESSVDRGTIVVPSLLSANREANAQGASALNRVQASRMVLAMGLGEETLHDRLHRVVINRRNEKSASERSFAGSAAGIEVKELLGYMASAASAIDELNLRYNVFHCDIKPQNILIVGGQAQVCDFGLARKVEDVHQTQMAFGTPAYGAPEMLFDRTYSKTIDQYSLAVTYYELRTGQLPYERMTQSSLLKAKATGKLDLSLVPSAEKLVLAKAANFDPEKRYPDCRTFVAALQGANDPRTRTSRRFMYAVAGIVVLLMVGVGSLALAYAFHRESTTGTAVAREEAPLEKGSLEETLANSDAAQNSPNATEEMSNTLAKKESLPETSELKPLTEEPEKPVDIHAQLMLIRDQSPSFNDRLKKWNALIESRSPIHWEEFSKEALEVLIEGVEKPPVGWTDSTTEKNRSAPVLKTLCKNILSIIDSQPKTDAAQRLRVELVSFQWALWDESSADLAELTRRSVLIRGAFDQADKFMVPELSATAAIALVSYWSYLYDLPNWEWQLAKDDYERAARVVDPVADLPGGLREELLKGQGEFLIGLLNRRAIEEEVDVFVEPILTTAKRLDDDLQWRPIGLAATLLVDHGQSEAEGEALFSQAKLLAEPPAKWPLRLVSSYHLARGWNAWSHGDSRSAFTSWSNASETPELIASLHSIDRHLAGSHLLHWLIDSAGVGDDDISQIRYKRLLRSQPEKVFDVAERLGRGSPSFEELFCKEKVLLHAALGDHQEIEKLISEIDSGSKETLWQGLTPQQAFALIDWVFSKRQSSQANDEALWTGRLVSCCVAISNPLWGADKELHEERREELFQKYFRPTMQWVSRQSRSLSSQWPSELKEVERGVLIDFCRRFVDMAALPKRRAEYHDVTQWLGDVETAAVIAGRHAESKEERSDLFGIAFEAFLHARYEQQDDITIDEVIQRLEEFHQEAIKKGTTILSDFMAARIDDQHGFNATNEAESSKKYESALSGYNRVIESEDETAVSLKGSALRCRAYVQARQAARLDAPTQREARDKAIRDGREATKLPMRWHHDQDDRFETLANVLWLSVKSNVGYTESEKVAMLNEADQAIGNAIELRRKDSLDYSHFMMARLRGYQFDLQASYKTSRFEKVKSDAMRWIDEHSDTSTTPPQSKLKVHSTQLKCFWHTEVARVLGLFPETRSKAAKHISEAYAILERELKPSDNLYGVIAIECLLLKSTELDSGTIETKRTVIKDLREMLGKIESNSPAVLAKTKEIREQLDVVQNRL